MYLPTISSLLTSVEAHYRDPDNTPYPGGENESVFDELTPYLETAGINDPLTKIYATTRLVNGFGAVHFMFVISQLPKLMYNKGVGKSMNLIKNIKPHTLHRKYGMS